MNLTDTQVEKFQEIYEKEFGVKPSKADAVRMGISLVNLAKTLLKFKISQETNNKEVKT